MYIHNWWQRWDPGRLESGKPSSFLCAMESASERVLVPDSLDSGSMGQRGALRSGAQTVRTKWSSPGLAGELESLLAGNLEQLSRSGRRKPGGIECAAWGDFGLGPQGSQITFFFSKLYMYMNCNFFLRLYLGCYLHFWYLHFFTFD